MADSINLIQKLSSTKTFKKLILDQLDKDCKADGDILDMILNRYTDPSLEVCSKCKIKSKIASKILDQWAVSFRIDPNEFKEMLKIPFFKRGIKSMVLGIKKYGFQKPFLPSAPLLVIWNFTSMCNLNCKHCYQNAGKKSEDELNFNQQKKVIDKLAEWGVTFLAFSGGEPLIHPNFFKLAEYTTKKGIALAIITNGTLITKEVAKKLKDVGLAYAEVSLDSLDKDEHDNFRGLKGAWEKTVEGIKNLKDIKVSICIITFTHKNNYKQIPKFAEFAKEIGVGFWAMCEYKPAGRGKNLDLDMSPDQREEALQILSDVTLKELKNKKENKHYILIDTNAPQFGRKMKELTKEYGFVGHYGFLINSSLLLEIVGGCAAGRAYIALQQNGDFTPCIFMPDLVIGNILKEDLESFWTSNQVLKDIRLRDAFEGNCSKCEYKYICGGCRARAYNYLGDITKPDTGCIHNKNYAISAK